MKKEISKSKELDSQDLAILSDLQEAYKMVEASRKNPQTRKIKHAIEQKILLKKNAKPSNPAAK